MDIKILTLFIMSILLFSLKAEDAKPSSCGNLLSTVMKLDPAKNHASLEKFFFTSEEFCDLGTNELKANFDVILFDKNNKPVNQKSVFLNNLEIIESLKSKKSLQFGKNKIIQKPQYRVVKFSIIGKAESIASYKIISKADNKIIGDGVVSEK